MDITCKLHDKEVKIKPWSIGQEKEALLNIEEEYTLNDTIAKFYEILVGKRGNLTHQEMLYVLIDTRTKLASDSFEITYSCDRCKQITENRINIVDAIKIKEDSFLCLDFETCSIEVGYGDTLLDGIRYINDIDKGITISDRSKFNEYINKLEIAEYDTLEYWFNTMEKQFIFSAESKCVICGHVMEYSPADDDIINTVTSIQLKDYYNILTELKIYNFLISEIENLIPFELELIMNNISKRMEARSNG